MTIKRITGMDETRKRLEALGFVVGETVTVISETEGNLIIGVQGTRIALNRSMAARIMV